MAVPRPFFFEDTDIFSFFEVAVLELVEFWFFTGVEVGTWEQVPLLDSRSLGG